jgi:hypothetical protein
MKWDPDWIYWSLLVVFIPLMISHMSVEIGRAWIEHRSRSKALDVLRVYAERGDEPPASVTEALIAVGSGRYPGMGGWPAPGGGPTLTRAYHMARVATNIVGALGWVGIAWWRMPDEGEPGWLVTFAVICAIFCAGLVAAHLVGVFTTPSGGRPRDDR